MIRNKENMVIGCILIGVLDDVQTNHPNPLNMRQGFMRRLRVRRRHLINGWGFRTLYQAIFTGV